MGVKKAVLVIVLLFVLGYVVLLGYTNYQNVKEHEAKWAAFEANPDPNKIPETDVPPPVIYTMCAVVGVLLVLAVGVTIKLM